MQKKLKQPVTDPKTSMKNTSEIGNKTKGAKEKNPLPETCSAPQNPELDQKMTTARRTPYGKTHK